MWNILLSILFHLLAFRIFVLDLNIVCGFKVTIDRLWCIAYCSWHILAGFWRIYQLRRRYLGQAAQLLSHSSHGEWVEVWHLANILLKLQMVCCCCYSYQQCSCCPLWHTSSPLALLVYSSWLWTQYSFASVSLFIIIAFNL